MVLWRTSSQLQTLQTSSDNYLRRPQPSIHHAGPLRDTVKMPNPNEHLDYHISQSPARQNSPRKYCSHRTPQAESSEPHCPTREARLIQSRKSCRLTRNTSRIEHEASYHRDTRIRADCTGVTNVCIGGCGRSVEIASDGISRERWVISCSTCLDRSAGRRWWRCRRR